MSRAGFTIWEILLVIFILAVIAALFYPVSTGAPVKKRQMMCAHNEKQLGLAIIQYVQDYDGSMPSIAVAPGSADTWRKAIFPYAKSQAIYLCPSRRDKDTGPDGIFRSYAANYNGSPVGARPSQGNGAFAGPHAKPIRRIDIAEPANLIALCEVAGGNTPEFNIDDPVHFGPETHLLWAGHTGGSDYLFADGHVRWLRPEATKDMWHRDATIPLSANGMAILAEARMRAGG